MFRSYCFTMMSRFLFSPNAYRMFIQKALTSWGNPRSKCMMVEIRMIVSGDRVFLLRRRRESMQNRAMYEGLLSRLPKKMANPRKKSVGLD